MNKIHYIICLIIIIFSTGNCLDQEDIDSTPHAKLSRLAISSGTLSPAFDPDTTYYTATTTASAVTVTPATTITNADITVNTTAVNSGETSSDITLEVGSYNAIFVVIEAKNKVGLTYVIQITKP